MSKASAPVPYDAVIVAGGTGERLGGVSKPDLVVRQARLLDHVLDAVATARSRVVVGAVEVPDGVIRTSEEPPRSGPAAGVVAGLTALGEPVPFVALLASDLAHPVPAVERLLDAMDPAQPVDGWCLTDGDDHLQWLLGIYRTASLREATTRLGDPVNRSMGALIGSLHLHAVPADDELVADIDTPADLRRHQQGEPT